MTTKQSNNKLSNQNRVLAEQLKAAQNAGPDSYPTLRARIRSLEKKVEELEQAVAERNALIVECNKQIEELKKRR